MKRFLVSMVLVWLVASVAASTGLVSQGSPPEIVFIDFPKQIPADGSKVSGFVGFKDLDGDLSRAEFTVVQAKDFQPFTLDLRMLRGTKEGVFEFTISTTTAQQVVLRVTLVDEAGNRSQPQEFSFEAVGTGAILQVSPTSLSFSSEVGRTPPSQTIQITNAGSGTLSWSASADQPWINLNPSSGMAPSIVTVSINAAGLAAGSYSGRITITARGAQNSPTVVMVNMTLRPPTPPAVLEVSPTQLEFRGQEGGSNPVAQTLTVRNTGEQLLTWAAQANKAWIRLNPASGNLQGRESVQIYVYVDLAGLSSGTYKAQITITAPGAQGSPAIVDVTLQLRASPAEAIYLTKPVPAPEGAILRLTGPNKVVQVASNLESPHYIICGPDQRLYVHDFAGGGRILRYNQDGSGRKVIVQDPNLPITTFVFAPNGDLYFGTWKQGLWRLKGADPANKPEQILPPSAFTFMAQPYAFLTAGPRKGDLLILDSPWSGGRGVSNRVLVARAPDFKVAEPFITTATYWPAGLALNSKGEIFVTMFYDGRIMRYNPDGSVQGTFSALQFANQIAIDSQDMVWVTNAVFRGNEISGGLVRFKPNGSSEWMLDRVVLVRGVTVCE